MNHSRTKKLSVLAAVLAAVCLLTFGVSRIEQKQEDIRLNGSTVLSVPVSSVTGFSLKFNGDDRLDFHRQDQGWVYDADEHFPASTEKIERMLSQFEDFSAAFTIDSAEDLSQYGLDEPSAVLTLTTDDREYIISMGDYSSMDDQRYVSIGDGNVYLAVTDPMTTLDVTLRELIQNVKVPSFQDVVSISFEGEENYTISRMDEGGGSHRPEDVWYTERDGMTVPLDPDSVDDYISALSVTYLGNYSEYYVEEADLAHYGLDQPELTVRVRYRDEDGKDGAFALSVSRDPKEVQKLEESGKEEDPDHPVTAYARAEGSDIVYILDSMDYDTLSVYQYDALRHKEVLPANFEDIAQLQFTIDHTPYLLTASGRDSDVTWRYGETELDGNELKKAVTSVTVTHFTDEPPQDKLELSYTATLNDADQTVIQVELHRYDGESCLAVVDGTPLGLVLRSRVIDLAEEINSIVLNSTQAND